MLGPADAPLPEDRRRAVLRDFGDAVDIIAGRYLTAEDVGTSMEAMTVIAEPTRHVTGLPVERGGSGDPSPWTALGVESALRVACERAFGTPSLEGRTSRWSVSATSAATSPGASPRAARASSSPTSTSASARWPTQLGATWVEPAEALTAAVDVLAPCALGGVLDHDSVGALRCQVVVRRGQQPARLARRSPTCWPPGASSGVRTSWPTPAGSSTSRSSSSPRATRPSAPTPACGRSATRCAPSSPTPRPRARTRWPRRWSSRADAWPRPASARPLRLALGSGAPRASRQTSAPRRHRRLLDTVRQPALLAQLLEVRARA